MITLAQPPVITARPLPPLRLTPEFLAALDTVSARRGLPPDPWPLP